RQSGFDGSEGFASRRVKWERGRVTEVRYYGPDGKAGRHRDGSHFFTNGFDERGNRTEVRWYGLDGKPTLIRAGFSAWQRACGDKNEPLEERHVGFHPQFGFHQRVLKYDSAGRIVETSFVGRDRQPAACQEGYARAVHVFDQRGNQTEEAYYDLRGNLV